MLSILTISRLYAGLSSTKVEVQPKLFVYTLKLKPLLNFHLICIFIFLFFYGCVCVWRGGEGGDNFTIQNKICNIILCRITAYLGMLPYYYNYNGSTNYPSSSTSGTYISANYSWVLLDSKQVVYEVNFISLLLCLQI